MKIIPNQTAPDFQVRDLYGEPVRLSALNGHKILLTFYRTAGCPVCNVNFHEREKEAAYFRAAGLVLLAVYASQPDNLLNYVSEQAVYPVMIPDPERTLYTLYDTERSLGKLLRGLLFHGVLGQMNKGKQRFTRKVTDDGPADLINADFLIDATGRVVRAHYGRYSGDFLPIIEIKAFAGQP